MEPRRNLFVEGHDVENIRRRQVHKMKLTCWDGVQNPAAWFLQSLVAGCGAERRGVAAGNLLAQSKTQRGSWFLVNVCALTVFIPFASLVMASHRSRVKAGGKARWTSQSPEAAGKSTTAWWQQWSNIPTCLESSSWRICRVLSDLMALQQV